jgi:4-amino-4-deoxy-L-arabinose transferase-like glycosyltransferase
MAPVNYVRSAVRSRPLVAIVTVGFVLRLVWAIHAARNVPGGWETAGDQFSYWYYGNEIAHGRGYISYISGQATAYYPIGYPALLGALYFVQIHTPLPNDQALLTALMHVVVGTASVALLHVIGRAAFSRRVGLTAAAAYAVYPSAIVAVATYSLETVYITSALGALAIVVTHDWERGPPSTRRLLGLGAALAVSVVIRPFSLPILIALAACYWLAGLGWRPLVRGLMIVLAVILVAIAPWTARNAVRFDAFVPFSNNLGDTMCMSRFPGSNGGFSWAVPPHCAAPDLPEAERNSANIRSALRFVRDHPGEEVKQWFLRVRMMMASDQQPLSEVESHTPGVLGATSRSILVVVTEAWFALTVALSVPGMVLAVVRHRRRPAVAAVLITTAFLFAIPIGLWGAQRFHAPLIPFFCLFAALTVWTVIERLGRSAPSAGDPVTEPPLDPKSPAGEVACSA